MKLISDDYGLFKNSLNLLRLRKTLLEMIEELKKSNQMLSNPNLSKSLIINSLIEISFF